MKILLTLFVLLFSSSVVANIFECTVEHELYTQQYVIKVDEDQKVNFLSLTKEDGAIIEDYSIFAERGEIIKLKSIFDAKIYPLVVLENSKKGSGNPFRGIFFKNDVNGTYATTIVIETWEKNMPFYLFEDISRKLLKGNCE